MRPAALLYNPAAGQRHASRRLARILEALAASGFVVDPVVSTGVGDTTARATELATLGRVEVVFALGGDGTLREVAEGLANTDTTLGCLPGGTANVLAYVLGIPRRPVAAARVMGALQTGTIDIGLCQGNPFLMMASSGWDAALMARPGVAAKRWLGQIAVSWEGFLAWLELDHPPIDIILDGEPRRVSLVAACNIPYYGGPFKLAPDADFTDGQLEAVLYTGHGRWALAGFLRDLALGRHLRRRDVELHPFRELRILGPETIAIQMDGDPIHPSLPITIGLANKRLRVLMR
ncbi:MAG: diacylglycerol kinase family protein [Acidobacteriota bacterium]